MIKYIRVSNRFETIMTDCLCVFTYAKSPESTSSGRRCMDISERPDAVLITESALAGSTPSFFSARVPSAS